MIVNRVTILLISALQLKLKPIVNEKPFDRAQGLHVVDSTTSIQFCSIELDQLTIWNGFIFQHPVFSLLETNSIFIFPHPIF